MFSFTSLMSLIGQCCYLIKLTTTHLAHQLIHYVFKVPGCAAEDVLFSKIVVVILQQQGCCQVKIGWDKKWDQPDSERIYEAIFRRVRIHTDKLVTVPRLRENSSWIRISFITDMTIAEKFRYKNLAVVPVFSTWDYAVRAKNYSENEKNFDLVLWYCEFRLLWPPPSPNPLQGMADALHRGRYFDVEPWSFFRVKLILLWKPGHCFFVGKSINIQVDQRRHLLWKNICHA